MTYEARKAELHVEVLRSGDENEDCEYVSNVVLEAEVLEWLLQSFAGFFVDNDVERPTDGSLHHASLIQSIRVVDYVGPNPPDAYHETGEVEIVVHAYELCTPKEATNTKGYRATQHSVQERMLDLPSSNLANAWDNLMFETINPAQILRSISRISEYAPHPLSTHH